MIPKELKEKIREVEEQHPYKKVGDANSYSQYNEGWTDACDILEQAVESYLANQKPVFHAHDLQQEYSPNLICASTYKELSCTARDWWAHPLYSLPIPSELKEENKALKEALELMTKKWLDIPDTGWTQEMRDVRDLSK